MTDLTHVLERLDLLQYLDNFIEEGFDTWEIVIYATESDLETLGLKLGHRRKLQKEIAEARGVSIEHIIGAIKRNASTDDLTHGDFEARSTSSHGDSKSGSTTAAGPSKRKYRRHPKPDENAPERAPSAYVIFSNRIREELKPQKLSFTDIAKTVGERWQVLDADDKELYETEAASAKEQYNTALTKYKRTEKYREYQRYLVDFKTRNAPTTTVAGTFRRVHSFGAQVRTAGTKRPRLETELSGNSTSSLVSVNAVFQDAGSSSTSRRTDSLASQPAYSPPVSSAASPTAAPRIPTRSHDRSLPSSASSTPVNTAFPSANTMQLGSGHIQPLPRILTLEGRAPRPSFLTNFIADPSPGLNPRRTDTASPAAFLRQDTSKSSVSSALSGNSAGSAYNTPVTPIEDTRASRSLPPIPALLQQTSSGSASSVETDRRSLSNIPPSWTDVGDSMSKTVLGTGYPHAFNHLSLAAKHAEANRTRIQPPSRDPQLPSLAQLPGPLQSIPAIHGPGTQSLRPEIAPDHMDPLSALVLAGRLVDRDSRPLPPSHPPMHPSEASNPPNPPQSPDSTTKR